MTYFHMAYATLSSALTGFTTEFEMGSGGSQSLWSSGETGKLKQNAWVLYGQATRIISTR